MSAEIRRLLDRWRQEHESWPYSARRSQLWQCICELEAALLTAAPAAPSQRCEARWGNHDQCVRPHGHREAHLTTFGFDWRDQDDVTFVAPSSAKGQLALKNAAFETPATQGDPPPDSPEDVDAHPWKLSQPRADPDDDDDSGNDF